MDEPPGVGAGHDLDSGGQGLVHGLDVDLAQRPSPHLHVGRADGGVELVDLEGGHEEDALIGHHLDKVGVIGEVAAVLDGSRAGLDGNPEAGATDSVAHGVASQDAGFVDQGGDLGGGELDVHGAVAGAGAGPAGGGELDDVGADPHHLANLGPHSLGPIGDAGGHPGVAVGMTVAGAAAPVGEAAGGGDDVDRVDQAGAGIQTFLDGHLEPGVQTSRVADAGVSGGQGLGHDVGGAEVSEGYGIVEVPAAGQIVALGCQVVVAVDQSGHNGHAGNVDDLHVRGHCHRSPGPRLHDASLVDEDGAVIDHRPARAVDQGCSNQGFHGTPPAWELPRGNRQTGDDAAVVMLKEAPWVVKANPTPIRGHPTRAGAGIFLLVGHSGCFVLKDPRNRGIFASIGAVSGHGRDINWDTMRRSETR